VPESASSAFPKVKSCDGITREAELLYGGLEKNKEWGFIFIILAFGFIVIVLSETISRQFENVFRIGTY
jgi:hypothetical protein